MRQCPWTLYIIMTGLDCLNLNSQVLKELASCILTGILIIFSNQNSKHKFQKIPSAPFTFLFRKFEFLVEFLNLPTSASRTHNFCYEK